MRSSFFEYGVAMTGLFTAQNNLNVSSNNIANAGTVGYSRQYAEQRAKSALSFQDGRGMIGTGSEVYGIGQIRSFYLDKSFWAESATLGKFETKATYLITLETTVSALGEDGIQSLSTEMFKTFQDLHTEPADLTARTNVINSIDSFTERINGLSESLKKEQKDANADIATVVKSINSLGSQIASLNKQIRMMEMDGSKANDLRDQRALCVDKLSKFVNVDVREEETNQDYIDANSLDPEFRSASRKNYSVLINGNEFVSGDWVSPLAVKERTPDQKKNEMDVDGLYDVYFKNSNANFNLYHPNLSGDLKAIVEIRDGNNGNNFTNPITGTIETTDKSKGIPYYMNKLNEMVRTFAKAMNEGTDYQGNPIIDANGLQVGHENGYDLDGNKGLPLFTYDSTKTNYANQAAADAAYQDSVGISVGYTGLDYSKITCENFKVNGEIKLDARKIAASSDPTLGESNADIIMGFSRVNTYPKLFSQGKLSDFMNGVTSELGIDTKESINYAKNYTDVVSNLDNSRISVQGVDLNEETTNIMKYQQIFQASSMLINTIDRIYDTMINRMGV